MTALVGLLCSDGIVIGSDSAASFAHGQLYTIKQPTKKVWVIENCALVAGTGQVGMGQRFNDVVGKIVTNNKCKAKKPLDVSREIVTAATNDFIATKANNGEFGALVGFTASDGLNLFEFATRDLQPERKTHQNWFVSMGSGQPTLDPFLGLVRKAFFSECRPNLAEGIFTAVWALQNVIDLCTGQIDGPVQIGTLAPNVGGSGFSARILDDAEVSEHLEYAKGAEQHLGRYKDTLSQPKVIPVPPSSSPPATAGGKGE